MIFGDLPNGATVFLDANVFIHHFEPNAAFGVLSTEFLERIENQEISGVTTTLPFPVSKSDSLAYLGLLDR